MDDKEYYKKNNELKEILIQLSEDIELKGVKRYYLKFKEIYSNGFRHDYSEITRILFSMNSNQDIRDYVASNINEIYKFSKKMDAEEKLTHDSDVTNSLRKLKDHINLENIRMASLLRISNQAVSANEAAATMINQLDENKQKMRDINEKVNDATKAATTIIEQFDTNKNEMEKINKKVNSAKRDMNSIRDQMKNSTTESITILSIFAGIVMAFSGGMSFISNAISGVNKIGPYRLSIFILLIGNIMFNVIFLLLFMIGKITNKYTGSLTTCSKPKGDCKNRSFKCYITKYPYIVWFNFIDVIGIVVALYLNFIDRFNIFTRFINSLDKFQIKHVFNWLLYNVDSLTKTAIFIAISIFICVIIIYSMIRNVNVPCKQN